ncbi:MAG: hypothetical protein A3J74_04870 [Elusimicrobia bacterium RIFCSPHIGHO2_02_FULL_57_9]|nr:MAG: hypothetical protein A3J74_04870 [Elusimicrobia bacterium RIFCSPHIGHO2_02_FULL_57_9]
MAANILIVDDEKDVVSLVGFLLEKDGHKVSQAYNGAEALEKMGVEPPSENKPIPDLIILDVMMPVMDGYSVTSKLAANSRTRSVPIIVLTAKGQMRDLFQLTSNVAAYLEKPFDPKHLRDTVASVLRPAK